MCLRHNGAPRLMSHGSVYCSDQASSLRSLPGLWLRRAKGSYDSMLSEPAGSVKAMQECSTVCGMCASQPSLYKARYTKIPYYHRVRSLRDLAPRSLLHFSVGFGSSLCRQRAPALVQMRTKRHRPAKGFPQISLSETSHRCASDTTVHLA